MLNVGQVNLLNPVFLQTITVFYASFISDGHGNFSEEYSASFASVCVQQNKKILTYKPDGNHTLSDIIIYSKDPINVSDSYESASTIIEYQGFLYVALQQEDWNQNGHYKTWATRKYQKKLEVACIFELDDGSLYKTSDGFLFKVSCEIPEEKKDLLRLSDGQVLRLSDGSLMGVRT